jgi:hypothetical protein
MVIKELIQDFKKKRAEEKVIAGIARREAQIAGRQRRVALARKTAVAKEEFLAKEELRKFKERRKPKKLNLQGGSSSINPIGNFNPGGGKKINVI